MTVEQKCDILIAMLEDMNANKKQPQIDLTKVETLTVMMQSGIDQASENTAQLKEVIEEVSRQIQQPVKTEHCHTFDIRSSYAFVSLVLLGLISSCLAYVLITERQETATMRDNDLKYRYIKMKGEAPPQRLSELEDLFEINRDNAKIRQLRKDIEDYERAVKEKAALDEQNRLRQQEAEQLNKEANSIRNK